MSDKYHKTSAYECVICGDIHDRMAEADHEHTKLEETRDELKDND